MKQVVCRQVGVVELAEVAAPAVSAGDILIKLDGCGICGTDIMKVYDPTVPKPVQLGHEITGTITELGVGVSGLAIGQRVAVAHHAPDYGSHYARRGSETMDPTFKNSNVDPAGFAEYIRVPATLVPFTVFPVPDQMPSLRAAFMEPLACCLRALDRAGVCEGDTVLVIGTGAIGILFVPLLVARRAKVLAVDVRDDRLELAREWGAVEGFLASDNRIADGVRRHGGGRGADLVILTSTSAQSMALAMASVRDGGTIVPFGVKPNAQFTADFWQHYRREINLVASYSATPSGLARAMAIMAGHGFELEKLVNQQMTLAQAQKAFGMLHEAKASKIVLSP